MPVKYFLSALLVAGLSSLVSQTSIGVGIYPTGTETGIGIRSAKNTLVCIDARAAKANIFARPNSSSMVSELSAVFRVIKLEKVRFHIGIGGRAEFNFDRKSRYGAVLPIGVEAFPFPFQNAGLFFEAAPFYTVDDSNDYFTGLRTVAGFVFYFPAKAKESQPTH